MEHKHAAEAGLKWFSKEYLQQRVVCLMTASRLLFTQPCDLFWSWEKTSPQTGKPLGGGYWTWRFLGHYWSTFLAESVLDTNHIRNSSLSKWGLISVLWSLGARLLRQVKVFNMFRVSELGFTSQSDICCLSLTISAAEITLFILLSGREDSSALTALPAILFFDSTAGWNLLTLHSFTFGNFCFKAF